MFNVHTDKLRTQNTPKLESTYVSTNWEISGVVLPCDAAILCRTFYITSGIFSSVAPCGLMSRYSKGLWFDSTHRKYRVLLSYLIDTAGPTL